jgi:ComF family protein
VVLGGVGKAIQALADFLIDERCHACGRAVEASAHLRRPSASASAALASPMRVGWRRLAIDTRPLCGACCHQLVASVDPVTVGALTVWPAFETDDRVLSVIHALKFSRRERLATWLAGALADGLPARALSDLGHHTVLVPVPMDRASQRRRGFNQAERLASALGAQKGLRVERHALVKTRATAPQSSLGRAERMRNVAGVMAVVAPDAIAGRNILLVDDLVTTGATAASCAGVLMRAGARRVSAVCVGYRP